MSNYLIELSLIHIALIAGYWFLLRKERQYTRMRFYLMASTLIALAVPLLKLPKLLFGSNESIDVVPMEAISLDAITISPATDMSIWSYDLLIGIYIATTLFFLFKFLSGVFYLIHLERKSRHEKFNDLHIRRVGNIKGSFTFFNWIFLSDEIDANQKDYEVILKHEKAHVSLGHTYDLLFFGLFKVCFWWLPTAWILIKEIKKIHEYQADAAALKSCDVDQYSSILISSTLKTNGLSLPAAKKRSLRQAGLASSFHDGLILKRLIAMKQQAKKISLWKLGALSALCASLIIVFACSEDKNNDSLSENSQKQGDIFFIVEMQPEYKGGVAAFQKYIMNEIKYPLQARQAGLEGRVDVQFVVEKDGSLSEVQAIKGIGVDCDKEAVRVLQNAPAFKPGTQNGKPVRVRMVVPIVFKLNEGKINPDKSKQGMVIIEDVQSRNEKFKVDANYGNGEWSGTVYDEEGNALPGVNILVTGTATGTTSGSDGTFKLKADRSQELYFSFVGYDGVKLQGK
jgi:TonB family protein